MLSQIKESYKVCAAELGDYQKLTVDELADGYCKATDEGNELDRDSYMAALNLRFWYVINKLQIASPNLGLEADDFAAWLVESIEYACKYRAWQDPKKKVNARQAINQCINTIRLQKYYDAGMDKRKANYNNFSLDTNMNTEDDDIWLDSIADETTTDSNFGIGAISLVQECINNKDIIDAIILDTIAFNDVDKVTKTKQSYIDWEGEEVKYNDYHRETWNYKIIQYLSSLPDNYSNYFSNKYHVKEPELTASIAAIRKATNQKLYKYLDACLNNTRNKLGIEIA